MPNTNVETNIPYGVVSLNSLAEWVADEFLNSGENITAAGAEEEFRKEHPDATDEEMQEFWDGYEGSEDEYELEADGMSLLLSYLGGAPLVWVLKSPHTTRARPCSPCIPGAGDLDSKDPGGMVCYDLPAEWYAKEE